MAEKVKKVKKPKKAVKKIKKVRKLRKYKPRTAKTVGTSMAEKEFKIFLESIGFKVDEQFQLLYKFYDFIIKDTKLIIEFHGSYWHGSPEIYKPTDLNKIQKKNILNDKFKKALAESRGYKIIYIWEHHFNNNKEKVQEYLLNEIKQIAK